MEGDVPEVTEELLTSTKEEANNYIQLTTPVNAISDYEAHSKDTQRMLAYNHALQKNSSYLLNKVVLDISNKNGWYAVFAIRAGARKCYIIEKTAKETLHTQRILKKNGYYNSCVVVHSTIDDLVLKEDQVDVIIHECMGVCLYVMSGIKDVIMARDKFLSRHGILLPNEASLYVAGINHEELRQLSIDFWSESIFGLNIKRFRDLALDEPESEYISGKNIVTKAAMMDRVNLYHVREEDLSFNVPFFLEPLNEKNKISALVAFFNVDFGHWDSQETKTGFSNSPLGPVTGWEHTVFPLDNEIPIHGSNELVYGKFGLTIQDLKDLSNVKVDLEIKYNRLPDVQIAEKRTYTFYEQKPNNR